MPLPFHRRRLDPDAADFCRRSGATDRAAINAFVRGVKDLGLWDKMVCWPLRSSQNAGTGTAAYSLGGLGTYNGTLVNGPTWGSDGISFAASPSTNALTINRSVNPTAYTIFLVAISSDNASIYQAWDNTGGGLNGPNTAGTTSNGGASSHLSYRTSGSGGLAQLTSGTVQTSRFTMMASADLTNNIFFAFNTTTATGALSGSGDFASNSQLRFGGRNSATGNASNAQSFVLVADTDLRSHNTALRDLYKSTLGTGLGLP